MQIDNFHLMSLLQQHPLQLLLSEWSQAPKPDDLDLLYDQMQLRTQVLQHLLLTLPRPEPFTETAGIESLENELALLNELSEYVWSDLMLLEQELDIRGFEISLTGLNQRISQVEAAMRESLSLQELDQEIQAIQAEIRTTFQQVYNQEWTEQYIWLLETRREMLLDRFEKLQQQIHSFENPLLLGNLLNRFRTLASLMESLEETIEAMDAVGEVGKLFANPQMLS